MSEIEPRRGRGRPPGSKNKTKRVKPTPTPVPSVPTKPTVVRSKHRGVRPVPFPIPPRPAELTAEVVEHVNWLIRRTGRGTADDAIRALAWLVALSGETDTERVSSTLAGWGIARGDARYNRLRAAIARAGSIDPAEIYSEIRAELDDPVRQRLVHLNQLHSAGAGAGRYYLPPRFRTRVNAALAATGLMLLIRGSDSLWFNTRQLATEINRATHGSIAPATISHGVSHIPGIRVVPGSLTARRIVGEKSDIIKKLDKFSLKQLKLLKAEYRRIPDKTASPEAVA